MSINFDKFIENCSSTQKKAGVFMYNSQIVAKRIKKKASENNIALGNMFAELGISNNTLHNMKTSMPKSDTLARIADYLNVSVDYLLGRTDNPEIRTDGSINIGNIGNNSNNNNHIQVSPETETQQEISSILSHLSFRERTELMTLIYKYFDEHNKGV